MSHRPPAPHEGEEGEQVKATDITPVLNIRQHCFYSPRLIPPIPLAPHGAEHDNTAQLESAQLDAPQLESAQLDAPQLESAQLESAQPHPGWHKMSLCIKLELRRARLCE